MEKLIGSDFTVKQIKNHINLRKPEDGDDTFPKLLFERQLHGTSLRRHL
jgi:hypothetical protein